MGWFGPSAEKVLEQGERHRGRLTAIKVTETGGETSTRREEYAVALAGGRRLGVRQRLVPADRVRLGMEVEVLVRGDAVFVDWVSTLGAVAGGGVENETFAWKKVDPPAKDGIVDESHRVGKAVKNGRPATVRIDGIGRTSALGGFVQIVTFTLAVEVPGEAPYTVEAKLGLPPFYAAHLATVGQVLPAFVDGKRPDRVAIDWPAAAEAMPGMGQPPAADLDVGSDADGPAMGANASGQGVGGPPGAPAFTPPPPINGVSWETYLTVETAIRQQRIKPKEWDAVAQRYGVPAGTWADTSQQWGKAMMRNADLQMAYAASMR